MNRKKYGELVDFFTKDKDGMKWAGQMSIRREDLEKLSILIMRVYEMLEGGERKRVVVDYDPKSQAVDVHCFKSGDVPVLEFPK